MATKAKTKKKVAIAPVINSKNAMLLAEELLECVCQCGCLDSEHVGPYRHGKSTGPCDNCKCLHFKKARLFVMDEPPL